VTYEEQTDKY